MSAHTQGPWKAVDDQILCVEGFISRKSVCDGINPTGGKANLRLMARRRALEAARAGGRARMRWRCPETAACVARMISATEPRTLFLDWHVKHTQRSPPTANHERPGTVNTVDLANSSSKETRPHAGRQRCRARAVAGGGVQTRSRRGCSRAGEGAAINFRVRPRARRPVTLPQ